MPSGWSRPQHQQRTLDPAQFRPALTSVRIALEVGITRHPRSSYEGAGAGVAARLGSVGFELFLASFSRRRLLLACSRRLSYAPSPQNQNAWGVSWISSAVIVTLAIGAIAGWLAGLFVEGAGFGLLWNVLIGIAGAFMAALLFPEIRARFDPRRRHCWRHCYVHTWRGCLASDRQSDPTASPG